jgi:hypothetical protein
VQKELCHTSIAFAERKLGKVCKLKGYKQNLSLFWFELPGEKLGVMSWTRVESRSDGKSCLIN